MNKDYLQVLAYIASQALLYFTWLAWHILKQSDSITDILQQCFKVFKNLKYYIFNFIFNLQHQVVTINNSVLE